MKKKHIAKKTSKGSEQPTFYRVSLASEREGSSFYPEYSIILKTTESVNNLYNLYKAGRSGAKGGPSTHDQQDLYRAMLVFACAGLDVFVKEIVKDKLSRLMSVDKDVEMKFLEYVQKGLKNEKILSTVALALVSHAPRDIFLSEYISSMTGDSLQSFEALCRVSNASGLDTSKLLSKIKKEQIKDAFEVRNQIIHEMDINVGKNTSGTTAYRTRRQRVATAMEKHIKIVLGLAEEIFSAYRKKFENYGFEIEKKPGSTKSLIGKIRPKRV